MSHSDVSSLLNLRKDLKLLMENQVPQINDQKIKTIKEIFNFPSVTVVNGQIHTHCFLL